MEALRQELQEVTDEDLVALSNKGTVKRAYKDLEGEEPCAAWREEETEVTLKEAVCTIRLPFAESTCSCPSRSMCRHRITAILWLRLESAGEQSLSKKEIAAKREAVPDKKQEQEVREKPRAEKKVNEMQAAELAAAWKEAFVLQFSTGLTRLSQETEESMERLALLSHRAGFAELERGAREAGSLYQQYFSRAVSFRTERLMQKLMGLYRQAEALEQTRTQEELRLLAGSFRDSYDSVGDLTLMGMGSRAFASDSGYEGEIYYFLETKRGDWYTWTDARPTFYEGRRRPVRPGSSQPAPWELNCSREQLQELEIHLTNAKVAKGNRLSVSQETRGEVLGSRAQCGAAFYGKMVWDYRLLAQQYFLRPLKEQEETDHLALLGAARCGEASFDQVEQRFDLPLYDSKGRMIPVSLRYSREERYTIRVLERLQKRLRAEKNGRFAFFGRLYLQKGRLCLYPIEFFDGVVLPSAAGEPIGRGSFTENVEPGMDERTLQDFTDYLSEAEQALADLYQSGLDSVLEETVNSLNRLGTEGEELGLHLAGKKLRGMAEALQEKRHRMGFDPMPLLKEWAELVDYLNTCRELTAQDTVRLAMEPKEV